MEPSPITTSQWKKVVKALYYSAASGFSGGFMLTLAGLFQQTGASTDLMFALKNAVIVGGVVGALNAVAVTIKQLFTTPPAGE